MKLEDVLNVRAPILITGPTGSGKSYTAKQIFEQSSIFKKCYVEFNISALTDELISGELFGHIKGSYTGAHNDRKGFLEEAENGTLFIDEIGDLSSKSQVTLLKLLDEGVYYPVGSSKPKNFKGRLIFATNKNLETLCMKNEFRFDLYQRIKTFHLHLDPINTRPDLLWKLLHEFLEHYGAVYQRKSQYLGPKLEEKLLSYNWSGNIRELKNLIHYLVATTQSAKIKVENLPDWFDQVSVYTPEITNKPYKEALEAFEREYFTKVLEKYNGKINHTVKRIGISKTTLIAKARKYGINTVLLRAHWESNNYDLQSTRPLFQKSETR